MENNQHIALLVVEPDEQHIQDFTKFVEILGDEFPLDLEICVVRTLAGAQAMCYQADWILSNVCVPTELNGNAEAWNGFKIMTIALRSGKPITLITDRYRLGNETSLVYYACRRQGVDIFDCPNAGSFGRGRSKPWKMALYGLVYTALAVELGACSINDKMMAALVPGTPEKVPFCVGTRELLPFFTCTDDRDFADPVRQEMKRLGFPRT